MNVIPLYPGAAPGSEDWSYPEVEDRPASSTELGSLRNVTRPGLIPYPADPKVANGTAMIVVPGGAFHELAIFHEGHDIARWLQQRGVSAFVLKYRVVRTPSSSKEFADHILAMRSLPFEENEKRIEEATREVRPLAVADGLQAVRVVRERAAELGVHSERVGMMGFSAGGYITGRVALDHDASSRLDYAAVIYGAMLKDPAVPADAPPLFMALTDNDEVAVEPSLHMYSAWRRSGHPVELHIYAQGDHGFGARGQGLPVDGWIDRFWEWLQSLQRGS
jgi:acetyl esterase/lipase